MSLGYELVKILGGIHSSGDEYLARCPVCGDSKRDPNKRRLQINIAKDEFVCFNGGCGAKGKKEEIKDLILNLGGKIELKSLFQTPSRKPAKVVVPKEEISEEAKKILFRALPFTQAPLLIRRQCIIELLPRKVFTRDEIRQLFIVPPFTHKGWDWRVIIPITSNAFQGKSLKGESPKYLSPPGINILFNGKLLNEDNWTHDSSPKIMTEGALDFHSLPLEESGVLLGVGRFTSDKVLRKLKEYDNIIYTPDSDISGFIVATNLYEERNQLQNIKLFYPHWAGPKIKDVNDLLRYRGMTKQEVRAYIIEHARSIEATYTDLLLHKIEKNPEYYRKDRPPGVERGLKWRIKKMRIPQG